MGKINFAIRCIFAVFVAVLATSSFEAIVQAIIACHTVVGDTICPSYQFILTYHSISVPVIYFILVFLVTAVIFSIPPKALWNSVTPTKNKLLWFILALIIASLGYFALTQLIASMTTRSEFGGGVTIPQIRTGR